MVIHLRRDRFPAGGVSRRACDRYPGRAPDLHPRPGRRPGVPVWPCTAWGLSCPGSCPPGGGLLPRLFTLTARLNKRPRRFILCDTFHRPRLSPRPSACFPRHAALRCSDFPLPPKRERPSVRNETRNRKRKRKPRKLDGDESKALRLHQSSCGPAGTGMAVRRVDSGASDHASSSVKLSSKPRGANFGRRLPASSRNWPRHAV